jgi:hypothetical protein
MPARGDGGIVRARQADESFSRAGSRATGSPDAMSTGNALHRCACITDVGGTDVIGTGERHE